MGAKMVKAHYQFFDNSQGTGVIFTFMLLGDVERNVKQSKQCTRLTRMSHPIYSNGKGSKIVLFFYFPSNIIDCHVENEAAS